MLSGDIDCWTLLLTSSRHLLLTVFRVSGGGAVLVLVVCVLLVCSLGTLSCCTLWAWACLCAVWKGGVGGWVCERLCVFHHIFILYLYVRLLTSGHIFDFSINLLHYVYMITIISCLLAYLLTIGNILSYLFYSGFVDPRFLWFSCTLAHLSGSPGSQSAPSIFIQHAYLPCVVTYFLHILLSC